MDEHLSARNRLDGAWENAFGLSAPVVGTYLVLFCAVSLAVRGKVEVGDPGLIVPVAALILASLLVQWRRLDSMRGPLIGIAVAAAIAIPVIARLA